MSCKGVGKCPYNVEGTATSEPQVEHTPTNVETMSCQECKWQNGQDVMDWWLDDDRVTETEITELVDDH